MMELRLFIVLFLLIFGVTEIYQWLGITSKLTAVIAAGVTVFLLILCLSFRNSRKEEKEKSRTDAAGEAQTKAASPAHHADDAEEAAFVAGAVSAGLMKREIYGRDKEKERARRDYDGNWDNPDDDSLYGDNDDDDIDYDQLVDDLAKRNDRSS